MQQTVLKIIFAFLKHRSPCVLSWDWECALCKDIIAFFFGVRRADPYWLEAVALLRAPVGHDRLQIGTVWAGFWWIVGAEPRLFASFDRRARRNWTRERTCTLNEAMGESSNIRYASIKQKWTRFLGKKKKWTPFWRKFAHLSKSKERTRFLLNYFFFFNFFKRDEMRKEAEKSVQMHAGILTVMDFWWERARCWRIVIVFHYCIAYRFKCSWNFK